MIKTLWIFLILLVSVWLGAHLQHDPGYVLIAINHWTVETTLWVGAALLIIAFVALHLLLLLFSWLGGRPRSWRRWKAKRRARASQMKTRQGLIEFSEGHWQRAKNHLIKALPDADTPLLNYLTAARAAQEMGDNQMRDNFLRDAQQCMPEAKIAVELTQAQLQLANRQWEQALATLRHLKDIAPQHPYVLRLLAFLYQEVKDWSQLIALLPDLKRNQVVTGSAYNALQYQAYLQALTDFIKQDNPGSVAAFYSSLPKQFVQDPSFVALYSHYLLCHHDDSQAELRLRQCLRQSFNEQLIELYGKINTKTARLDFAESLLKKNPHSAVLHLCLGRLSESSQLWGKAKTYFEGCLQLGATPAAYAELGELHERLGDQAGAFSMYRQGLNLVAKSFKI